MHGRHWWSQGFGLDWQDRYLECQGRIRRIHACFCDLQNTSTAGSSENGSVRVPKQARGTVISLTPKKWKQLLLEYPYKVFKYFLLKEASESAGLYRLRYMGRNMSSAVEYHKLVSSCRKRRCWVEYAE